MPNEPTPEDLRMQWALVTYSNNMARYISRSTSPWLFLPLYQSPPEADEARQAWAAVRSAHEGASA